MSGFAAFDVCCFRVLLVLLNKYLSRLVGIQPEFVFRRAKAIPAARIPAARFPAAISYSSNHIAFQRPHRIPAAKTCSSDRRHRIPASDETDCDDLMQWRILTLIPPHSFLNYNKLKRAF